MFFKHLASPQRRNLALLFGTQSLGGSAAPIVIAVGGLIGQQLTPDPALATLPVSLYGVGVALAMLPVALSMRSFGRKQTYLLGALISILSASAAGYAIFNESFFWFCAATLIAGFYGACVQNYRFAASDLVPADDKPDAISMIMVGGLAAAVIGPQVVIHSREAIEGADFAGSFIGQALLALIAIPIIASLRLPETKNEQQQENARPLAVIARSPGFIVAVTAATVSYALMAFIMTSAPIAMVHHGHSADDATLGIQWHILAMFGPSFFTGKLIKRFGARAITAIGLMILFSAGLVAIEGLAVLNFWSALILLGIGWNFGFIGATALLTKSYRQEERAKVQALNDFLVFGVVAISSLAAGQQFNLHGWIDLNMIIFPVVAMVLLALVALPFIDRKPVSQS